jgi:hypothetical protein
LSTESPAFHSSTICLALVSQHHFMNLRIVFHLFASDFRRFKWLLAGLWACVIFSALPWLFFEPDSEVMLEDKAPIFDWIGSWLGLCYAAALGLGYREWGSVKTVRKRELAAARICSLVLWVLVPEGLLVGINLLVHGLGVEVALREALGYGFTVGLVLATVAAFASWCASWRLLLAGAAAAAALHGFCEMMPGLAPLPLGHLHQHLWSTPPLADLWPLAASAALLGGLRPAWGGRSTERFRLAVAVGFGVLPLALAGFSSAWRAEAPAPQMAGDAAAIRAVIRPGSADMQSSANGSYFSTPRMMPDYNRAMDGMAGSRVGAIIDMKGCPDGWFVRWSPNGRGGLSRDGRLIAPQLPEQPKPQGYQEQFSDHPLADLAADELAAITACLPGKTPPVTQPADSGGETEKKLRYLGIFAPDGPEVAWDEGPLDLVCSLAGTAFRYERVIDVPLGETPVEVRVGQSIYQVKRLGTDPGEGWVELTVKRPGAKAPEAAGGTNMPPPRGFLHVPGENTNLLLDGISRYEGPLLAGARWERRSFGHRWLASMNRSLKALGEKNHSVENLQAVHRLNRLGAAGDVRFILLEPRPMALLPDLQMTEVVRQRGASERRGDYGLFFQEPMNEWIFIRDHLANRPDPRTCTDEEFFRWLRVIGRSGSQERAARELACYGRRFGEVLAGLPDFANPMSEIGNPSLVSDVIPDAALAGVLPRVDAVDHPEYLLSALIARGRWGEIVPSVRRRLQRGDMYLKSTYAMQLEDPAFYDLLIDEFIKDPTRISYDGIRLLPGIGDRVDQAIDRAVDDVSAAQAVDMARKSHQSFHRLWIYPIAAARGNAKALEAMLAIRAAVDLSYDDRVVFDRLLDPTGHEREGGGWSDKVFDHKSAADFRFDTRSSVWRPVSTPTKQ